MRKELNSQGGNNRTTQFLRNIGIYAIGSVGSRVITFLLVPIYSFFIAPEDFGYYDLCLSTVLFVLPLISMDLREGAFRFLLDTDNEDERRRIVTMSMATLLLNSLICVALGVLAQLLLDIKYLWYTIAFAISFSIYDVAAQMLRALGYSKLFAATGILCSFCIFLVSVPLVAFAKMGVEGIFIGNILARIAALAVMEWRVKLFSCYLRVRADLKEIWQKVMRFSLPLVVVNLIINGITLNNRYMISQYLGFGDNGQYAVAVKFAAILDALVLIFNQSWQETAIKQYADADRDEFYSKILNTYIWVLVAAVIGISYGARLMYGYIVGAEYQESVWLVYPLVMSTMFLSLAIFYDMGYQCSKQTGRQLPCLLIALALSVLSNYLFIRWWGLPGAICSNCATFLFMLVYKMIDTRKYMKLRISHQSLLVFALLFISMAAYYVLRDNLFALVYLLFAMIVMVVCCPVGLRQSVLKKFIR